MAVNILLFVVDVATGDGWWFYWPLLGWGLGMLIWGATLFAPWRARVSSWQERKTRELMERERLDRER